MFGKSSKSTADESLWGEAEELPRAGLPDARKLHRRGKWLRGFVWASVFLFPLALVALLASLSNSGASTPTAEVTGEVSESQQTAAVTLDEWLRSRPRPIPGGRVLSHDSTTVLVEATTISEDGPQVTIVAETYTVGNDEGEAFTVTVTVAVDERGGAIVIAEPSVAPGVPPISDNWAQEVVWVGLSDRPVSHEPVKRTVELWAQAYLSGDPESLRLAVGDGDASNSYLPLNGVTLVEAVVQTGALIDSSDPSRMVVRARLKLDWGEVGSNAAGEAVEYEPSDYRYVDFDVLVVKADTAAPVVVAWGPAGSGPSLEPYGNAVRGDRSITTSTTTTEPAETTTTTTTTAPPPPSDPVPPATEAPAEGGA